MRCCASNEGCGCVNNELDTWERAVSNMRLIRASVHDTFQCSRVVSVDEIVQGDNLDFVTVFGVPPLHECDLLRSYGPTLQRRLIMGFCKKVGALTL